MDKIFCRISNGTLTEIFYPYIEKYVDDLDLRAHLSIFMKYSILCITGPYYCSFREISN